MKVKCYCLHNSQAGVRIDSVLVVRTDSALVVRTDSVLVVRTDSAQQVCVVLAFLAICRPSGGYTFRFTVTMRSVRYVRAHSQLVGNAEEQMSRWNLI